MATKSTILLLGGTGKISSRTAPILAQLGYHVLQASRSGSSSPIPNCKGVKFDWYDEKTYETVLSRNDISAIFLIAPLDLDVLAPMQKFIELATSKGIKRFILLSATVIECGGWGPGKVHEYLASLPGVEWAVLRPTWFMEKFSEPENLKEALESGTIHSATGKGKIPWIAAADIAAVAAHVLTHPVAYNKEFMLVGPELLSYDDATSELSKRVGKEIKHLALSETEEKEKLAAFMSEDYAAMLAELDTKIKNGEEELENNVVEELTGKRPLTLKVFLEKNIVI